MPPSGHCGNPVGSAGGGGNGFGPRSSGRSPLLPFPSAEASNCPAGSNDERPSPPERGVPLADDFESSKYS